MAPMAFQLGYPRSMPAGLVGAELVVAELVVAELVGTELSKAKGRAVFWSGVLFFGAAAAASIDLL